MYLVSSGIDNGIIKDEYGGLGSMFNVNGMPTYSLPFEILEAPKEAVSFALVLEDRDAYPVTKGFSWVHWLACNIIRTNILANESQTAADFVQGNNSWTSVLAGQQEKELSCFYGGMTPPDKDHVYTLKVYALDTLLPLETGFYMNELYHEMSGHVLDKAVLEGIYPKVGE